METIVKKTKKERTPAQMESFKKANERLRENRERLKAEKLEQKKIKKLQKKTEEVKALTQEISNVPPVEPLPIASPPIASPPIASPPIARELTTGAPEYVTREELLELIKTSKAPKKQRKIVYETVSESDSEEEIITVIKKQPNRKINHTQPIAVPKNPPINPLLAAISRGYF